MPKIDRETILCGSFASKPSNFGCTIHNQAYEYCDLNFIYKPFAPINIEAGVQAIRALGIRGVGVSMPFKESVLPLVDRVDETAREIGAINTIVNDDGVLTGYNTDYFGAWEVLKPYVSATTRTLIIGAGGVSKAICKAIQNLGGKHLLIANRTLKRAETLAEHFSACAISLQDTANQDYDILINATSVGMAPNIDQMIISEGAITPSWGVMDVVVMPMETKLIQTARSLGKDVIPGYQMSLLQAAKQFTLYTGRTAPLDIMKESMIQLLSKQAKS